MSDEPLINPEAIFIPDLAPEELESTAAKLIQDGKDVAQAGQDIKSSWQALAGVYSAPESDELVSAINPVATTGDEFSDAMGKVGEALQDFAEKAGKIKKKLLSLQSEARIFVHDVASQEDWRSEPDNVTKHNDLIDQVGSRTVAYQNAERECANKITGVFGGTTFVPQGGTQCKPGEVAYGAAWWVLGEDTPTAWGSPQKVDHPWYVDAWDGGVDIAVGVGEFAGGATGLYGRNGWASNPWEMFDNYGYFRYEVAKGVAGLVGVRIEDDPAGGANVEVTSRGETWEAWKELGNSIVPVSEWDERPGYTVVQGAVNLGLMAFGGVGAVKSAAQGAKGAAAAARAGRAAEEAAGAARNGRPGALGAAGQVGRAPAGAGALPTMGEIITAPNLWGPAAQGAFKNLLKDALGMSHHQPSAPNPGHNSFDGGRAPATGSAPDTHAGQGRSQPGSNAGATAGSGAHRSPAHTGSGSPASHGTSAAPRTPQHAGHASGDPTTSQIQRELDLLEERIQRHNGDIDRALDEHIRDRQPQPVGAGATARNGDRSPSMSAGDSGGPQSRGGSGDSPGNTSWEGNRWKASDTGGSGHSGTGSGGPGHFDSSLGDRGRGRWLSESDAQRTENGNGQSHGSDGQRSASFARENDASDTTRSEHGTRNESQNQDSSLHSGGHHSPSDALDAHSTKEGSGRGYYDQEGNFVDKGHRDSNGNYYDEHGNKFVDTPESEWAARSYEAIRDSSRDVQSISRNTGIDKNVLDRMKNHIFFREHDGVAGPPDGTLRDGRFAPMQHIADLWLKAEKGTLDASESTRFRHLVMHEAVESRLMETGIPYRHRDPSAWEDGTYWPSKDRHGAHDIAPLEHKHDNPFILWGKYGYGRPPFDLAADLSNLDAFAEHILSRWTF
ncbi:hypothetical protein HNR23_004907 [Nocardiopsis mwathae]|uniref:WXG100 family type VII secretion target n=1 Tax=Nocardiopsis mwathae TaxID=1472723 RepID=A0A7W9YMN5_9ACTN|nr:hypothetical protein [Nocardiopsis mwathae]MBB6174847.1 hypothetical protein [Nocardiopsis mwathae]